VGDRLFARVGRWLSAIMLVAPSTVILFFIPTAAIVGYDAFPGVVVGRRFTLRRDGYTLLQFGFANSRHWGCPYLTGVRSGRSFIKNTPCHNRQLPDLHSAAARQKRPALSDRHPRLKVVGGHERVRQPPPRLGLAVSEPGQLFEWWVALSRYGCPRLANQAVAAAAVTGELWKPLGKWCMSKNGGIGEIF
jgi:hypothetical protein